EAKRYYDEIDLVDKVQKKILRGFQFPFQAAIIGAFCLLIVFLSLYIKKENVFFKGTFYVTSATYSMRKDWSSSGSIKANTIQFSNISEIESSFVATKKKGNYFVIIENKSEPLYLNDLAITKGATVDWTLSNGDLGIHISRDSLNPIVTSRKGTVNVEVTGDTSFHSSSVLSEVNPAIMQLHSIRAVKDAVRIDLSKVNAWSFDDMMIDSLDIMKKVQGQKDVDEFYSTMIKGKIKVREGGNSFELQHGDNIHFEQLKTRHFSIRSDSSLIRIDLEGTASKIKAGPKEYEDWLNPTYAEYVFHESWIAFFYSSFIFLWGVLWSLNRMFFKHNTND
ncbi:MAG TPA: hypothetical protein VGQ59_00280, partial [Cyclobacteriaceae bacterium]|nr:hypothetical protein [Cyclobacteriaceae bacterium]